MSKIKIGHDSEMFAREPKSGKYIPLIGCIGGTKAFPLPVPGGNLQEDNVSGEIAIDPTTNEDIFVQNTFNVLDKMREKIEAIGCEMVILPAVEFEQPILAEYGGEALACGCDPDYNAYTKEENTYPPLAETPWRVGSGHLHIDIPSCSAEPNNVNRAASLCDIHIKAPLFLLEGNNIRNDTYGALGNYRPKSYGIEYRSVSNIILTDEKILRFVFRQAKKINTMLLKGNQFAHIKELRVAMQENNTGLLQKLMKHYRVEQCS